MKIRDEVPLDAKSKNFRFHPFLNQEFIIVSFSHLDILLSAKSSAILSTSPVNCSVNHNVLSKIFVY